MWYYLALAAGVVSVIFGWLQIQSIMKAPSGDARMREIAAAIQEGANAYLGRQYRTIGIVGVIVVVALAIAFKNWQAPVGFIIGAVLSGAAGFIGMKVSVQANVRTTEASKNGLNDGLKMAFKSGAVTGLLVVGLALIGIVLYYGILTSEIGFGLGLDISVEHEKREIIDSLVALGFGASLIS
ncbi:MAG: sodium/proton-translocating pyrophosphatase, partial [Hyphomonas sp.]|nr:sodium/proton-translocating pyrophosphatase [Hyphomonas sp.]